MDVSARADLVVDIDDVTVTVNGRQILGPVSFRLAPGEHWALLGPNGAGKTTLLSLAGAERHPSTGTVHVLGRLIGRTDLRELRKRIGSVGHLIADRLPPDSTALEVVLTGRDGTLVTWWSTFEEGEEAHAREMLSRLRCERLIDQPFGRCSQGERQRILLARSLYAAHPLLLLDEPAVGVDLPGRESLVDALDALAKEPEGPASVHVVHTLEELPGSTTHALLLREGRVVVQGPIEEVLTDEHLSECFGIAINVRRHANRYAATSSGTW